MSKNIELQESINEAVEKEITAKKLDGKDAQEYVEELREGVRLGDQRAVSSLQDLVNLIVITYNYKVKLKNGMSEFINQFIDEARDDNGNGRRYIYHPVQKGDDFQATDFVPTAVDASQFKVHFLKFKNDRGALEAGSIQKRYRITYQKPQLITYFINGQLDQFIEAEIASRMNMAKDVFLYDHIMKKLIDTSTKGKAISGVATDLFACLTTEVFPAIEDMKLNSSDYNVDRTFAEGIDASSKDDLIMLLNVKVATMIKSNLMSQLFNAAKISLTDYVGQIHIANREFDFTGPNVKAKATYYVPANKIFVIDKRHYFRVITMLSAGGDQDYPLNMTHMKVYHQWLASGYLPWGKVLTYTNANLTVSPSTQP